MSVYTLVFSGSGLVGFENYKAETSADSNIAVGEFQKILKLTP